MAGRKDIVDGSVAETAEKGIVYTKRCGWIDLGHAIPSGAKKLWESIRGEKGESTYWDQNSVKKKTCDGFVITYGQYMEKYGVSVGVWKMYKIKKNLTFQQKKSVALSIFIQVSLGFEFFQSSWPYVNFTDSGFSGEDMVSDLISFYRAVEPGKRFIEMSEPVSKKVAQDIWDRCGEIGKHKNKTIQPLLFPFNGKGTMPSRGSLPYFLNTVKPVKPGKYHKEV